ncbi:hypothetical protein HPP92_015969 [Vanilla planifolia]|uniref:Uncharacterized protein n=1 Tax=Vanilla planifolia TaxID=51239 RepID=A0A835QMQ7_VANPL|nr:hypothetical protein HPP92_015969 [Vanilla planifolia]
MRNYLLDDVFPPHGLSSLYPAFRSTLSSNPQFSMIYREKERKREVSTVEAAVYWKGAILVDLIDFVLHFFRKISLPFFLRFERY